MKIPPRLLGYDCSRTRLRFARKLLFCLGTIIAIMGCMTFIKPDA